MPYFCRLAVRTKVGLTAVTPVPFGRSRGEEAAERCRPLLPCCVLSGRSAYRPLPLASGLLWPRGAPQGCTLCLTSLFPCSPFSSLVTETHFGSGSAWQCCPAGARLLPGPWFHTQCGSRPFLASLPSSSLRTLSQEGVVSSAISDLPTEQAQFPLT